MTDNKLTYKDLEQRILFLEQELQKKNERLSILQEEVKEKERKLQEITSNFEILFNTIDDFLFVIDEQGNIIHYNTTVEKRLGYTPDELKGKSVLNLHPEELRSEAAQIVNDIINGKIEICQIPLITKQGKQIFGETRANRGIWNGKPVLFEVSKDITNIKISEEKFSTVFYLNPSACSLTEANSGRYLEVNDAFCKLFGFTREETIGHTAVELQIITQKASEKILSKADSYGRINNIEADLITKNGDVKKVLLSGQNISIQDITFRYTLVHDVTEIHKAKQEAEENERKFSIAFHSSPSVSMITNIDTGEILEANDAVEQFAGFSIAEMKGNSTIKMNLWIIKGDREKFINILHRDKKVLNFESKFRKKNGEVFIGLISGQIIQIQNQNCLLSIIHDITELKKTENELIKAKEIAEENEKKFSMLLNACPEPLSVSSLDDGRFIIVNDAFLSVSGYEKEEIINRTSNDIKAWVCAEDRQRWANELVKNGSIRSVEFQLRTKKYGIRDFLISSDIIELDKKKCTINFYIDITDRKNAELELLKAKEKIEESESKFKNLYESLSISYLIIKDRVCIECNEATLTIFGVESKDDVIGKSPIDFAPEFQLNNVKSSEEVNSQIQTAIEKGFHTFEWIALRKNKKEDFFAEISLKKFYYKNELYIQCLTTDITERKMIETELIAAKERAEENERNLILKNDEYESINEELRQTNDELIIAKEKIEESESKFKNLYESLSITYIILKDGVCIDCNEASLAIHGVKCKDELIGKSPAEFSPEFQPNHIKSSEAAAKNMQIALKKGFHTFEWVSMRKNKEEFYAEVSLKKFYYKNEIYIQCLTTDITERKRIENELIAAKEKAEESDRLKTAFLQNMSHEIRTPLNAICGFSSFLSVENLSGDKRKNFVQIIQNSSNQLLFIVNDILTVSSLETKQEKINISKVCLNNIIVESLAIFAQQVNNQNISLYAKKQLSDKQSEIYSDKTKITQILSNLLSNALKFTHVGKIEFGYQLTDNTIQFYVKDSGIGIKPELYEKIFERFRQADKTIQSKYGGTGLGLSICKGFVELLGGKIWVESEIEKGSTFYFTIPYNPVNEIDKTISPIIQNKNFRTVLVAEDDEYNYLFIEEILVHLHLHLIHTKDGQETVDVFKANPKIDLILMDIKMPIMNGHDAAKIIKSINPDLPIMAQSAYATEYERAKYSPIFDDYLIKPIKGEILVEMISKYINIRK